MTSSIIAQAETIGTSAANYPPSTRVISINELETLLQSAAVAKELEVQVLLDAIDNLEYDNYEIGYMGARDRQADAELIRAAFRRASAASVGEGVQELGFFAEHEFAQLPIYEDGRTPLLLTEPQYNAIRRLVQADAAPPASAVDGFKARLLECLAGEIESCDDIEDGRGYWFGRSESYERIKDAIERGEFDSDTPAAGDQEAKA